MLELCCGPKFSTREATASYSPDNRLKRLDNPPSKLGCDPEDEPWKIEENEAESDANRYHSRTSSRISPFHMSI